MLTTERIPKSSEENTYFSKEDSRVVVFNHVTEKSMIIGKEAASILQFFDGEKTYEDLFRAFPEIGEDDLKQFAYDCVAQGYAYDPCSEKKAKKHISMIYYPERIFAIRNKYARYIIVLLLLISPITAICGLFIQGKKVTNFVDYFGKNSILGDILIVCILLFISLFIHEISHAVIAKFLGANVGEISVRFERRFPLFRMYTRICGISYIKKLSGNLLLYSAGILSHCFLISLSLFVTCISDNAVLLHWFGLSICVNIFLILSNLLPFPKTDGFVMLSILHKSRRKSEGVE